MIETVSLRMRNKHLSVIEWNEVIINVEMQWIENWEIHFSKSLAYVFMMNELSVDKMYAFM